MLATKRCSRCDQEKPFDEGFYNNRAARDGKQAMCKSCCSLGQRAQKYKMTYAEVEVMLERGCAACGSCDSLCIDHDHSCCPGKYTCGECVRGVLCNDCNRALGYLGDDPDRITSLLAYTLAWE